MTSTLLLDLTYWDLLADANGNIAIASEPYRIAQDVATAVRVWLGEQYYNTAVGIPYATKIMGQAPSLAFLKAQIETTTLNVPGVAKATCYISGVVGRQVQGQIQIVDTTGTVNTVTL